MNYKVIYVITKITGRNIGAAEMVILKDNANHETKKNRVKEIRMQVIGKKVTVTR